MRAICLYLHVHQPYRVRAYSIFEVARDHNYWKADYYSKQSNERIFKKVAEKSYHPMLSETLNVFQILRSRYRLRGHGWNRLKSGIRL